MNKQGSFTNEILETTGFTKRADNNFSVFINLAKTT